MFSLADSIFYYLSFFMNTGPAHMYVVPASSCTCKLPAQWRQSSRPRRPGPPAAVPGTCPDGASGRPPSGRSPPPYACAAPSLAGSVYAMEIIAYLVKVIK